MKETDFIIVGSGLAGITFAHTLHKQGASFKIISLPEKSNCSIVAAGLYNPVVFYRLSKSYMVDLVLPFALEYYSEIEKAINTKILHPKPLVKLFTGENEAALWEQRREEGVGFYLGEKLVATKSSALYASDGMGVVKKTGSVDCENYIQHSLSFFESNVEFELFDYDNLQVLAEGVSYKNIKAKYLVFCEGYWIKDNPYFSKVTLKPVKGETLTIEFETPLSEAVQEYIVTRKCFLLPVTKTTYKVGATYNWNELNDEISESGLAELTQKISEITAIPFKIIQHRAGVRPSASDRRPIIGAHPEHPQLLVFNGLGTKGVMLAPYYANELMQHLTTQKKLHKETDVQRFFK